MRVSGRLGALLAAAAMCLAGGASASTIEHLDSFDDYASSWMTNTLSVEQLDRSVTLEASPDRRWNATLSRFQLGTNISKLVLEHEVLLGEMDVRAAAYGSGDQLVAYGSLAMDPSSSRFLPRDFDMNGADYFRVQFVLAPGSRVAVSELKAISGAPEPTAALLLAMGMTVTGVHLRARKSR